MSARRLKNPNQAIRDSFAANDKKLSDMEAKSFGAGAVREVFIPGNISCARNAVTQLASTTCDPGRWSVIFSALARLTVPEFTDETGIIFPENKVVTATLSISGFNSNRTLFQTCAGQITQQVVGTTISSFDSTSPVAINLSFQWSSNFAIGNAYQVSNRQITLIPL